MQDTTDALELLKDQHDEVLALFDRIDEAADDDEKLELFTELADKLAAHSAIEAKDVYPSVLSDETCDLLLESTEEHLAAKRTLADLLDMSPDDDHWEAKLTVLEEQIRHHAKDEEEGELFPKVRGAFSVDELAAIGNDLIAMFEDLLEHEPRMHVPAETSEAAPL